MRSGAESGPFDEEGEFGAPAEFPLRLTDFSPLLFRNPHAGFDTSFLGSWLAHARVAGRKPPDTWLPSPIHEADRGNDYRGIEKISCLTRMFKNGRKGRQVLKSEVQGARWRLVRATCRSVSAPTSMFDPGRAKDTAEMSASSRVQISRVRSLEFALLSSFPRVCSLEFDIE